MVDEGARAGGQIYRRPPDGFIRPPQQLYGSDAGKARALHALFDAMAAAGRVDYRPQSSVHAVRDGVAHVGATAIPYDRLILATGATDRLVPVDGWQRAGVYSLGAAQIALKAQGVAIGRQIVLAGSGPLLTLVAAQLLAAGAGVAAVLDTSPLAAQAQGGIGMALARPAVTARGLAMRARLGRLYHAGVRLERIADDALHWRDAGGRAQVTECDAVALGWHLRAETQLADLAGARFAWSDTWAQWLPVADQMGRAGRGLYLAGDGLRILGADGAEVAGALAASACLNDLGIATPGTRALLRRARRLTRFAAAMARAFPWPGAQLDALPDTAVLCRCEGITLGQMRAATDHGGPEANRVKSLGRVGMGRCQGRYCQLAAADLIARHAGLAPQDVGRLRGQPPVRPVPIGALLDD
ncbi:FAD/NAD(P)-dependent oxidoreductase [Paracoccus thiocyanatus]|uniref:FAD/NAD(P)-dependent oxidoreductase n=1 Tax=Paracoccus thiocyanatus TaxID=34006 RepID=UPI001C6E1FA5|nr:NAD(P)/FAD-dependent oxidoreductase [Paracoccus thiocyanatus]